MLTVEFYGFEGVSLSDVAHVCPRVHRGKRRISFQCASLWPQPSSQDVGTCEEIQMDE